MTKPVLKYDSRGPTGNIFWILGQTRRLMRMFGRETAWKSVLDRVQSAGSYDEALAIIGEEVTLIDTAK